MLSEFSPILATVFAGMYAVFSILMLEHYSTLAATAYPTLFAAPVTAFFSEDLEPDGDVIILLGVYLAHRR